MIAATRLLSALLVVLGVAIVASTIARGGGPLANGTIIGALFIGLGAGRLFLARG